MFHRHREQSVGSASASPTVGSGQADTPSSSGSLMRRRANSRSKRAPASPERPSSEGETEASSSTTVTARPASAFSDLDTPTDVFVNAGTSFARIGSSLASDEESVIAVPDHCQVLRVVVHSARDLLAKDLTGTSDPFVRIFLDGEKVAESSSKRESLNPIWNQAFRIPLPPTIPTTASLRFEVLNEYYFGKVNGQISNIGKHAFLGQVTVMLASFLLEPTKSVECASYALEKRSQKSRVRGSLCLSVRPESRDAPEETEEWDSTTLDLHSTRISSVRGPLFSTIDTASAPCSSESFILNAEFLRVMELPIVDIRVGVCMQLSIRGNKALTPDTFDLLPTNTDGILNMTGTPIVSMPYRSHNNPRARISIILTKAKVGGLFDVELGSANINVSAIPVVDKGDDIEMEKITPVDLFLEKKMLKRVPHIMKLRDPHGSVCRIRVRLWLEPTDDSDIESDDGVAAAMDDADDDSDDEKVDMNAPPPPPIDLPTVYHWELLNETYSVSLTKLHKLIFDSHSPFIEAFCKAKEYTQVNITPWSEDDKRTFAYLAPKTTLVKANFVTEKQEYVVKESGGVVVDITTETLDVPYGKDFVTLLQYQLIYAGPKEARLKITAEIKFYREPMISRMIQNGAKSGMSSTFQIFHKVLKLFTDARKKKALKGAKGGTASAGTSGDEAEVVGGPVGSLKKHRFSQANNLDLKAIWQVVFQVLVLLLLLTILWQIRRTTPTNTELCNASGPVSG